MAIEPKDLFPGRPDLVSGAIESLKIVKDRLDQAVLHYRFMWQMMGEGHELPNEDAMILIVTDAYIRAMREWDGNDSLLPMTFAAMTVREVTRDDR